MALLEAINSLSSACPAVPRLLGTLLLEATGKAGWMEYLQHMLLPFPLWQFPPKARAPCYRGSPQIL